MICATMPPLPGWRVIVAAAALAAVAGLHLAGASAVPGEVRIAAGKHHRRQTIVEFDFGATGATGFELRSETGETLPLQVEPSGRAWFVVPSLDAGGNRTYRVTPRMGEAQPAALTTRTGMDVAVSVGGRPVLGYVGGAGRLPSRDINLAYQRGGYIHPVRTPSGRIVTDDYPADHRHQHGVMMAWTSAVFEGRKTDFWNMGQSLGRVETRALESSWDGPVHAGWLARHRHVDLTSGAPKPVLDEAWTTRVYAVGTDGPALHVFDVVVRQTPATSTPLSLPEYHYGGMAVRGAASFMGAPGNEVVLTSEGKDRATADNTRARWVHISGQVDGARAGIAMLGHPGNFRAPEPLRVHPTDPYVCFAPSRLGAWSITADRAFEARYRFVAMDGPADAALLERLWRDFAEPPVVTLR
jgi:hypothetical protein